MTIIGAQGSRSYRWLNARGQLALLVAVGLFMTQTALADDRPGVNALLADAEPESVIDNSAFSPSTAASPANHELAGNLSIAGTEMRTEPELSSRDIMGSDPGLFPAVDIQFFTHKGDLVPVVRDVIRHGTRPATDSFWDIIVQPGRVWSEEFDGDWSRAAFPFALVNEIEGETHHGLGTFVYDDEEVSQLRFQIVEQTAPFYVTDYFVASGQSEMSYRPGGIPDLPAQRTMYQQEIDDRLPMQPWGSLAEHVPMEFMADFDPDMRQEEILVSGIVHDGTIYYRPCSASAGGELPYCDRMRFGVWSVTKATSNTVALFRLAQKYGADVLDERIVDYVEDTSDHAGWRNVTFQDVLNMATGVGHGSDTRDPNDIDDGYIVDEYYPWYEAPSVAQKVDEVFRSPNYPWGPGEVARYRDHDMFVLGVAMNAYLREREGPTADIWDMVAREVYRPIGIHHAPMNRTIESNGSNGSKGQAMMAYGHYPSLQDLAKIGQLFHAGGRHDGEQILHAELVDEIVYGSRERGLATGSETHPRYHMAFWYAERDSADGCRVHLPEMRGWGGNMVSLMPGGNTGFRIANNWDGEGDVTDTSGMHALGETLAEFCP